MRAVRRVRIGLSLLPRAVSRIGVGLRLLPGLRRLPSAIRAVGRWRDHPVRLSCWGWRTPRALPLPCLLWVRPVSLAWLGLALLVRGRWKVRVVHCCYDQYKRYVRRGIG